MFFPRIDMNTEQSFSTRLKMDYTKNKAFGLAWVEKCIEAELIQGNRK
jgi:hypothetical protein